MVAPSDIRLSRQFQRLILPLVIGCLIAVLFILSKQQLEHPQSQGHSQSPDHPSALQTETKVLSRLDWNAIKRKEFRKHLESYLKMDMSQYRDTPEKLYSFLPSTYECDRNQEARLGNQDDGGKWFCGEFSKPSANCAVFSFGSCGDFSFEESIYAHFGKQCQVQFSVNPYYFSLKNKFKTNKSTIGTSY
jgi:hypothetical protein